MNLFVQFITLEQIDPEQIFFRDTRIILLPRISNDLFASGSQSRVSQKNKFKNRIEFLPEQHQNQHRVRIHQGKQPGHRRSMVEEITHGHTHCHVSPGLL